MILVAETWPKCLAEDLPWTLSIPSFTYLRHLASRRLPVPEICELMSTSCLLLLGVYRRNGNIGNSREQEAPTNHERAIHMGLNDFCGLVGGTRLGILRVLAGI